VKISSVREVGWVKEVWSRDRWKFHGGEQGYTKKKNYSRGGWKTEEADNLTSKKNALAQNYGKATGGKKRMGGRAPLYAGGKRKR